MAVITHARPRTEADYYALPTEVQKAFDTLTDQADHAGTSQHFFEVMARIAQLIGMPLPASGDIRRCACSCICGQIFDAEHPDAHVIEESPGYNLGRLQCPWCADQHRETA